MAVAKWTWASGLYIGRLTASRCFPSIDSAYYGPGNLPVQPLRRRLYCQVAAISWLRMAFGSLVTPTGPSGARPICVRPARCSTCRPGTAGMTRRDPVVPPFSSSAAATGTALRPAQRSLRFASGCPMVSLFNRERRNPIAIHGRDRQPASCCNVQVHRNQRTDDDGPEHHDC